MTARGLFLATLAVLLLPLAACRTQPIAAPTGADPAPFDHSAFDRILRAHVRGGRVDYAALKAADSGRLREYVASLAAGPASFVGADDELAFWLNAYNAFVIAGVIARYPDIKSVMDIPDFFRGERWEAAGQPRSLDQIENQIIRPKFKDSRIHFVLVCGAQSCPPLQPRAMHPATLQAQLDRAARAAVNDARYVQVDRREGRLRLTRVMSWYRKDFVESDGSLEAFLLRYLKEPARTQLGRGGLTIEFMDYDWALNDAGSPATK